MSEKRARYIGHPDGIEDFPVPVGNAGETRRITLKYGDELPNEIDKQKVPAAFRDSLLEQDANWTDKPAKTEKKEG